LLILLPHRILDASADNLINDEKDFVSPPGHSTTTTPDFISLKVDDQLRCEPYADFGEDAPTDSTF